MLNFLGRGMSFNPKEGNTAAYFIENNELFLIDCGESVFARLHELEILEEVDKINVLITHTHSDHIGSIGTLLMYAYYVKNIVSNIVISEDLKYINNIQAILDNFGCEPNIYKYVDIKDYDYKYNLFNKIRFFPTVHSNLESCGLKIGTTNGIIIYSGDTNDLGSILDIINSGEEISKIYVDTNTSNNEGRAHLSIDDLDKGISKNIRT